MGRRSQSSREFERTERLLKRDPRKVGTFTLISMEPPAHGRWPAPVVLASARSQLMDTARQYAADESLYFRPDDEEARQP